MPKRKKVEVLQVVKKKEDIQEKPKPDCFGQREPYCDERVCEFFHQCSTK